MRALTPRLLAHRTGALIAVEPELAHHVALRLERRRALHLLRCLPHDGERNFFGECARDELKNRAGPCASHSKALSNFRFSNRPKPQPNTKQPHLESEIAWKALLPKTATSHPSTTTSTELCTSWRCWPAGASADTRKKLCARKLEGRCTTVSL